MEAIWWRKDIDMLERVQRRATKIEGYSLWNAPKRIWFKVAGLAIMSVDFLLWLSCSIDKYLYKHAHHQNNGGSGVVFA